MQSSTCEVPCCDDGDVYWVVPFSITKAMDSLKQPNVLFQMSVADSHSLKAERWEMQLTDFPR